MQYRQPCSEIGESGRGACLVVLTDDLNRTLGEVESERNLRRSEVRDGEEDLVGEEGLVPEDEPSDTGVGESVLVTTRVDGTHVGESEVPFLDRRAGQRRRWG